ncbi:MAG: WD40/YVTN/BNR-like repeat-containing protein, partial [Acidobacteriota bacterium]
MHLTSRALGLATCLALALGPGGASAKRGAKDDKRMTADTFAGLVFRSLGPGLVSGRVTDLVVEPGASHHWFVAAASGGVWETTSSGTTWTPLFDREGSFSIGCLALDPTDPLVLWVGTGENNSQRSVSYGDGVYKSVDGGKTWKNLGLVESEHIGKIVIDPRDTDTVYVAAQGPLWRAGGDRGLYKTTDGGRTWEQILEISENTGINEVLLDPRDPDVLYATAYQRRRRVWTLVDGGPESAIYKSTDAGATWTRLGGGLPGEDMGRIGMAISPARPDVIYAIIEAAGDAGGFYRSRDAGESWKKMSDYVSSSPQYYNEIVADPHDVDRVYSMDTFMQVTEDGGAHFSNVGERSKHVDNHVLWIDPLRTDHLLAGCDGGVYDSFDRGKSWRFRANLPITQFYRAAVDNDIPFYNIYGGTQDNATIGGPSRTRSGHGITNADWFVTVFGDGFETQVDPEDPDIVYSEYQHGGLVRFDRLSGERVDIQPQPEAGEPGLRWNWDSPLIISPHSHTRLYFGANRLYRSDDRGDSWRAVSPDLTRQLDRNTLPVMGRVQSVDAVAKNASTSFFGNIVALSESPLVEGLLYAGTDDGLVQVTEDGGVSWRRVDSFPVVPDMTRISDIEASWHDPGSVRVSFDAHKNGDFRPYVLRSDDYGDSWE